MFNKTTYGLLLLIYSMSCDTIAASSSTQTPPLDSSRSQPLSSFTVFAPGRVNVQPTITNGNFSAAALPICPQPLLLDCPGINGVDSQGKTPTAAQCPDTCTQTRVVIPATGSPILSYTPAMCPPGYSQIASYNMQPEIINTSGLPPITNIPTIAALNNYRSYGYTCTLTGATSRSTFCDNADSSHDPWYMSTPQNTDVVLSTGYVGQYKITVDPSLWYATPANCAIWCGSRSSSSCSLALSNYNTYWTITWTQYVCTPPASNVVYTNNAAPASVVCERTNEMKWQR